MEYSPALSAISDFSDMTDEELDKYFASCAPLSNLPTPPPSKEPVVEAKTCTSLEVRPQAPELEVYASQLSNLVPANAAPSRPAVPTIQGFLERAQLPTEVVAFAACILDALSQRFASAWRTASSSPSSPLQPDVNYFSLKRAPSAGPEVIVLSALSLAHGFLSDRDRSTRHWAQLEGACLFTVAEIEATKWCILQDMDFGLLRITDAMVQRMARELQRSSKCSALHDVSATQTMTSEQLSERKPKATSDFQGAATWEYGMQTPEPSP